MIDLLNKPNAKKELRARLESLRLAAFENIDNGGDISFVVRDRAKELTAFITMIETALKSENQVPARKR